MKEHYQVKWTDPKTGEIHYGRVVTGYGAIPPWQSHVGDAVIPVVHTIDNNILIDIPMLWSPIDEYHQYVDEQLEKAQKLSDSLPPGVHVGSLFNIGVADGYAWYVVTKVNKKTCKIEWRCFCPDGYTDHHFRGGGKFPIEEIERYVSR